jgi:hypothetical protein
MSRKQDFRIPSAPMAVRFFFVSFTGRYAF